MSSVPSPRLTFLGPETVSYVKAVDEKGVEVARFAVESPKRGSFNISRVVIPNTAPVLICTSHKSSLSGKTTMMVHGQDIEFSHTLEGLQTRRESGIPGLGKVKWVGESDSLSGKRLKLVDADKQVVAEANLKDMKMEVFALGDEMMLDCLLASYIALVKAKHADAQAASDWVQAGAQIVGAFAGGGGGGG